MLLISGKSALEKNFVLKKSTLKTSKLVPTWFFSSIFFYLKDKLNIEKAGSPVISSEIDKKGGNKSFCWFLGNVVNVSNNIKPRHLEWQGSLEIGKKYSNSDYYHLEFFFVNTVQNLKKKSFVLSLFSVPYNLFWPNLPKSLIKISQRPENRKLTF